MEFKASMDNATTMSKRTVAEEISDMVGVIGRLEEKSGMLAAHIQGEKYITANLPDDISTIYDDGLAHLLSCLTARIGRCASLIGDLDTAMGDPARLFPASPTVMEDNRNRLSPKGNRGTIIYE